MLNILRKFIIILLNNKIYWIVIWYGVKIEFMIYYKKCDYFN